MMPCLVCVWRSTRSCCINQVQFPYLGINEQERTKRPRRHLFKNQGLRTGGDVNSKVKDVGVPAVVVTSFLFRLSTTGQRTDCLAFDYEKKAEYGHIEYCSSTAVPYRGLGMRVIEYN